MHAGYGAPQDAAAPPRTSIGGAPGYGTSGGGGGGADDVSRLHREWLSDNVVRLTGRMGRVASGLAACLDAATAARERQSAQHQQQVSSHPPPTDPRMPR